MTEDGAQPGRVAAQARPAKAPGEEDRMQHGAYHDSALRSPRGFRWTLEPDPDRLLLVLGPEQRAEVLVLAAPSPWVGARLRRFCRLVIETPGFLDEG